MGLRRTLAWFAGWVAFLGAVYAFQRPFRQYPGVEYDDFPMPPDWQEKTEWAFARLMYPNARGGYGRGFGRGFGGFGGGYAGYGDWTQGNTIWTQDYPRADRHFSQAIRRLTRVQVRSVEQPVNLDDGDDVYNWPWLYAVQVGHWSLTDAELAAVWKAASKPTNYDRIIRLLILTGCRANEVGGMQKGEIDIAAKTWTIPASRYKTHKPHVVYLSAPALKIITMAMDDATGEGLFEAQGGKLGRPRKNPGFHGWSKSKAKLDALAGVTDWTHHDLRRTMRTSRP